MTIPYEKCGDEEKQLREIIAEEAEEILREMGIDDEDFIECVLQDVLDGESIDIETW